MEAPLQQRIVGAIVLVTLGVIFIPALLDGSGYKSRQVQDIKIREKPEFPPLAQKKLKPIATPLEKIRKCKNYLHPLVLSPVIIEVTSSRQGVDFHRSGKRPGP